MYRLLLLTYLSLAIAIAAPGTAFSARVIGITDGDTMTVIRTDGSDRNPIRVRLYGIDTPERKQPFYARAREFTSNLAFGKTVRIEPRGRHFDRLVSDVVLPDGRVLNHAIVRAGLAWWFVRYAPGDAKLRELEAEASLCRTRVVESRWSRAAMGVEGTH
jgi:endonuclease YncB( thermonuclease family)